MMPVHGHLDLRCLYGAPWLIAQEGSAPGEIAYHIVVSGSAVLEDPSGGPPRHLKAGDILLLPHGAAHTLHDGSGQSPVPARERETLNLTISENGETADRADLLCGRERARPQCRR
jgi:AraC family transcriptional activator of mtrCDE